jgi:hypothetical protein
MIVGLAASAAWAGDQPKDKKPNDAVATAQAKNAQAKPSHKEAGVKVTGSYIPQNIHRYGRITDGQSQLIVLDQDSIRRSGATDLKQVLNSQGIH